MDNTLKARTKEENRREFRRNVLCDFVKYYGMLTDKEAFAVHKIIIDAKDRFTNIKEEVHDERG